MHMWRDVRLAGRLLLKSRMFTAGVVALLAFAVAANTVIFSLVDALLLRPLPVRDPERLVRLVTVRTQIGARSQFLVEEYEAWKKQASSLQDLFAWSEYDLYVTAGEGTERARVHFVTDNFFSGLGATPFLGRLLTPEDQSLRGGMAPVVLSHPYWKRRFRGDSNIVGRVVEANGHKVMIVGVTARGFNGLTLETSPDIRIPLGWLRSMGPELFDGKIYCEVAGRVRAGFGKEAARQQAEAIWLGRWKELNGDDPGLPGRFDLEPAARGISRMRAQFSGVLWLLMGGVALLMLMVCANVAGLLMARTASRQSELAVRVALGAAPWQLARLLFSEAVLLMTGGATVAVGLSLIVIPLLADALPPVRDFAATRLTLSLDISPDWRVLGFAIAVSAATVLLFGMAPALTAARRDVHPLLKEVRGGGSWRGRQALVALQSALCTMLLVGAGLTVMTLRRLETMNAGFDRSRIVTFSVDPDMAKYTPEQSVALRQRLVVEARRLPAVESAAVSVRGLMRGTGLKMTTARAGERAGPQEFMNTSKHGVSPEYFETMRILWVAGRNFTGREDPKATPKPAVVNEAFVRHFGGGRPVIGQTFGAVTVNGAPAKPVFEVIGVVGDTKYRSMREPFQPIVYELPDPESGFIVHLRTRSAPESVIEPMRKLLAGFDSRLSYVEVNTLASEVSASLWPERVAAFLAGVFSAAAALIAGAGLYALIAFAVMQRQREIGIRVALGALPGDVVRLMLTKAAWLAAAGIAIGLGCAWVAAPKVTPILYEVKARDASVLIAAAGVALVVAAVAAMIPSFGAARIQPSAVLRQE